MSGSRIVVDAGGTNVRFAAARDGGVSEIRSYPAKQFPTLVTGLALYLLESGQTVEDGIAIGAAGPVDDGRVQLTNAHWQIDERAVAAAFGNCCVRLVNDVEAVAHALPALAPGDVEVIGPAWRDASARRAMLALNVGTGFGAAAIVPANGGWAAVPGEAGHMSLANGVSASVEDVLSGRGLNAIYATRNPSHSAGRGAAGLFEDAKTDAGARQTIEDFGTLLGKVAGDLVLATGAWGGVYLCGSVAEAWHAAGAPGQFRRTFEAKGAMSARIKTVHTGCIVRPNIALAGLARVPLGGAGA